MMSMVLQSPVCFYRLGRELITFEHGGELCGLVVLCTARSAHAHIKVSTSEGYSFVSYAPRTLPVSPHVSQSLMLPSLWHRRSVVTCPDEPPIRMRPRSTSVPRSTTFRAVWM